VPFEAEDSLAYSYNDLGRDYYQLTFQTNSAQPGDYYPRLNSNFSLWSESPLALDTDQFPDAPPSDSSLYQSYVNLSLNENSASQLWWLQGRVLSIEQQPVGVPEPSTALIFAAGLVATGLARRKRQA
jgi:hypothetical protein